ncbi:MAG: FkbM family methyltransferase [Chloroflexi bacterium]|nr:FkbM family methyltransferase [Chloroflexota bacterium]
MVWLGLEEEQELRLLPKLLEPNSTFIDCGANIGIWTVVAGKAHHSSCKVWSFEPNPLTFHKLQANVSASRLGNVRLFRSAVGGSNGTAAFETSVEHNVSRIIPGSLTGGTMVSMMRLDSVLPGQSVCGVKIDVEGAELGVIEGCLDTIRCHRPWLCVEFNTLLAGTEVLGEWDVDKRLRGLGYVPRRMQYVSDRSSGAVLPSSWRTSGYVNLIYRGQ